MSFHFFVSLLRFHVLLLFKQVPNEANQQAKPVYPVTPSHLGFCLSVSSASMCYQCPFFRVFSASVEYQYLLLFQILYVFCQCRILVSSVTVDYQCSVLLQATIALLPSIEGGVLIGIKCKIRSRAFIWSPYDLIERVKIKILCLFDKKIFFYPKKLRKLLFKT